MKKQPVQPVLIQHFGAKPHHSGKPSTQAAAVALATARKTGKTMASIKHR